MLKAEVNVHPLGLITKYPCKHFLFCNTNKIKPKKSQLGLLKHQVLLPLTSNDKKEMSEYHTCLTYAVSFAVADAKHSTDSETAMQ